MTDPTIPAATPESFGDLPIQPTGSGVADLEIAYEQMRLAEDADADADAAVTSERGDDMLDSAAHPS